MLWINEALYLDFWLNGKDSDREKTIKHLNQKVFTVKDSSLSYRTVNSLDESKMLSKQRKTSQEWRKFSVKDLIYLETIKECRKYNLTNAQLINLKKNFYELSSKQAKDKFTYVDIALLLILGSIKISLLITDSGEAHFADLNWQTLIDRQHPSYLYINFNNIVDKVLKKISVKKRGIPEYLDWNNVLVDSLSKKITRKELEILKIIRDKKYSKITIKRKDNNVFTIYGESVAQKSNITEIKLLKMFKEKDFRNLQIQRRNGQVVNYKLEDVYKL